MENGNFEQKYQESNILKNQDRYQKIYLNRQNRKFFRLTTLQKENDLDEVYGYNEPSEPGKYTGWLVNMHTGDTLRIVSDDINGKSNFKSKT